MHLQAYLEEFTFRFNRRKATNRGLVFYRLLQHAVLMNPIIQDEIKGGYWNPNEQFNIQKLIVPTEKEKADETLQASA